MVVFCFFFFKQKTAYEMRISDWSSDVCSSDLMERFDGYYGGATDIPPVGKACVDRVIFKMIPENASRVAALLAGDVHIIDALPTHAVKQVENNPGTHVLSVRGTRSSYIALNNQKPPFDDVDRKSTRLNSSH